MRFKGTVNNWGSERRETDKESTAWKERKNVRPANNVEIMNETCMAGSRRLRKKKEWDLKKKSPDQGQGMKRKGETKRHVV